MGGVGGINGLGAGAFGGGVSTPINNINNIPSVIKMN